MVDEKTLGGSVETGGAKAEAEAGGLLNPPLPPNSGDGADKDSDSALLSPPLPPNSGDEVEAGDSDLLSPPLPPNSGDEVAEPAETESDKGAEETNQGIDMATPTEDKSNGGTEEQAQGIEPSQEGKDAGEQGISAPEGIPSPNVNSTTTPQKTAGSPHSTEPFYRRRRILIILAVSFMVFVLLTVGVVCYVMSSRGGQEGITGSTVNGSASGSVAGGRYTVSVDGAVASDDGSGVLVSVTWRNMGNVVDYMPDAVRVLQNGVALVRDKGYSDAHSMFMVLPGESITVSYKYLTSDLKTDLEVQVGSKASGLVGTTVKIRGE